MMRPEEENANVHLAGATQGGLHYFGGAPALGIVLSPYVRVPPRPCFWLTPPAAQFPQHYRNIVQAPHFMHVREETTFESNRLYKMHLKREACRNGIKVPLFLVFGLTPPYNMRSLITLAEHFRSSPQRQWVYEQARTVELNSLNFQTFRALLSGLFNEGGVTWERILVLFFFCSDLTMRVIRENLRNFFYRIYQWTMCYFSLILSHWVERHGGWEEVLAHNIGVSSYKTGLLAMTLSCLGFIALFVFIKTSRTIQ